MRLGLGVDFLDVVGQRLLLFFQPLDAGDELVEILGEGAMDEDTANAVIMAAREHWFAEGDNG